MMRGTDIFTPQIPIDAIKTSEWTNLHGSATALAISNAAHQIKAPLLVVCENNESVDELKRELRYFCADQPDVRILSLPDWETLPYDNNSPHQDLISDRLTALHHFPHLNNGILVLSIVSLMHRLAPRHYLSGNSFLLKIGDTVDLKQTRQNLIAAGYNHVESVYEHGEFAIRGSIMDVFPMGSPVPYRIDLLDDEIETLRTFDTETQRTLQQVKEIHLLPGREYPLDSRGISKFRSNFQEKFDIDLRQCPLYQDVSDGIDSPGLEYYLSLFFDQLSTLFDFLPEGTVVCTKGNLHRAGQEFWNDIKARYDDRVVDQYRPILPPEDIFLNADSVLKTLKQYPRINLTDSDASHAYRFDSCALPELSSDPALAEPFAALTAFVGQHRDHRFLFCAESPGRRETLLQTLQSCEIHPELAQSWTDFVSSTNPASLTVAPLDQGLWLKTAKLIVITEAQIFGNRIAQRRRRGKQKTNTDFIIKSLTELRTGDAVVHIDHGVGRYRGLQTLTIENQDTEFLTIEYAKEAKLYVPVASLHLVSRYSGANPELAPLNQLGTDHWQKTKRKAAEKIRDTAAELLDIYARREAKAGYVYDCASIDYEKFVASFPFEETDDQEKAITAVLDDMQSVRAMDRLICGDVGFGKTEVAMRAAFVAVQNGKQVAILVPTTLLAQQHYESFKDRFADWPIVVDVISRFKSAAEQELCIQAMVNGKTDILIGTHKLLHTDLNYNRLSLLIIDEEHRFGVRQKEKLKAMRANVDILTLTATPIPRTLNMALSEIRDLSLIVTPPAKRLSVKTLIRAQTDALIKEAVLRELLRGGQVFYLHNDVKTIDRAAEHLQEIVPQGRICVAHGQMPEKDLERIMADFYHKRYNILVCTTIIETGIDIPSANTIIMHRADKLGLAQLHQLRGRVGRSHHQAYAYLLLPHQGKLGNDAQKRIDAIQAASTLGAGFTLASHDLEIRGAGELLGDEQSGQMHKIGFSLYTELLQEAVSAIKSGRSPDLDLEPATAIEVNLRIPALIPEDYLPDVHTRLILYKRISAAADDEELRELREEIIDRFGLMPEPLQLLFELTSIKLAAQVFGIRKIDANVNSGRIEFNQNTDVDPLSLVNLLQENSQEFRLAGPNQLNFSHNCADPSAKLQYLRDILNRLKLIEKQAA